MSSSTVSAPTPTRHQFERRVDEIKPSKTDINSVIMDYLISEGYPSAARKFALEANVQPAVDAHSIEERVEIRKAIHAGDIQAAIERINELNPEYEHPIKRRILLLQHSWLRLLIRLENQILDLDASLHFALLRLQLIEIIRSCNSSPDADINPALTFASSQLAPRAPTNPEFLKDLERTMALLIFPLENLNPDLAPLLDPRLRQNVASRVNEAILSSQGLRREARIKHLIKCRAWAEKEARRAKKDIPTTIPLGLEGDEKDRADGSEDEEEGMHENGDADLMVS